MKDGGVFTEYGRIRVVSCMQVNSLQSFEFTVKPNVHAEARLNVLLEDTGEETDAILERMNGEAIKAVEISADGSEMYPPLFTGMIRNCEIRHEGRSREAVIYAVSGSIQLDIIKKSRSYQDTAMSYKEIISDVLKDTQNTAVLYTAENKMLDKPVIQYQETDFSFAVRLASHQNTCIYPDINDSRPRLSYGLPEGRDKGEISPGIYQMGTNSKDALQFYEITCGDNYYIGDTVWFDKKRLKVCSKKGILQKGLIYFSYVLAAGSWIRREKIYHPLFPGISLKATVLQCRQEYVKLHLDIDQDQDKEKAYSFLWKPVTGNLMYCMPEAGTKVYLNIAGREEGDAHAVSCIRENGAVCQDTQAPERRFLSNESGKNIKLHPDNLEFQGREKDNSHSLLGLRDNQGVTLQTNQAFTVKADGEVQFRGKKVILSSAQEFTAVKKDMLSPTVMNLNQTIDILGGKGKVTSGGGKEITPLIQGRRIENYDISDIKEQILSSIPQGEEEDVLSTILAASFMNTLYSGKGEKDEC